MNILVTGGAGYIGSHTVQHLQKYQHNVWVLDNLSRGNPDWLDRNKNGIHASIHDTDVVQNILNTHAIDTVIHFAAYAYVGESVEKPLLYYHNNVEGTRCLLEAMTTAKKQPTLVFSSTCATYGIPEFTPIDETHPTKPINPYGHSKLMVEQLIKDAHHAYDLPYVILRYFNAAGASTDHTRGECHDPEPHLIPNILLSLLNKTPITIHGKQYPTPDGTCIRDYIHVEDLASAHRHALEYLDKGNTPDVFNLGTGQGYSVLEILNTCEEITQQTAQVIDGPQRPGDPPKLIANPNKAKRLLKWTPQYSDLPTIIQTAWQWHKRKGS